MRGREPGRRALEVIPADKLILSSDCGFGRQGFSRTIARTGRSRSTCSRIASP